ncbi:hypothetical protein QBC38DRAFT_366330 [Podospora fimiseda]|uniref:Uncharacterized protein n=1 Tax=Podospora fimiseda TaxID=252190 RepID=A0AAN7BND8_9PEZI|nr:hypothetical protein QBC38DRAFT_366330 [Podospora fimiseda]
MRAFTVYFLLSALTAVAVQASVDEEYSIILERQAPGTPKFQCHSDCGNIIAGGRLAGHCNNSTWIDLYESCLRCASTFDIWSHYSSSIGNAAAACSFTPSPLPSGGASPSESASDSTELPSAAISTTPPPALATQTPAPAETITVCLDLPTILDQQLTSAQQTITTAGGLGRWTIEPILGLVVLATILLAF